MSSLALRVNGVDYAGWQEINIRASMEAISRAASLRVTDRWGGVALPLAPGHAVEAIADDSDSMLSGYIDSVTPDFDAGEHALGIYARDKCADLVDCSLPVSPSEYNNIPLLSLAKKFASPFGVAVKVSGDAGETFGKFPVQIGETAFEALDRACRLRGLLAMPDMAGGIEIAAPGVLRASDSLIQGDNILRATGTLDNSSRFRDYTVLAQMWADDETAGDAAAHPWAVSRDAAIARYRPLVIVAEMGADIAAARKRAQWEAAVRAARSRRLQITVQGWRQNNGSLWQINRIVYVRSSWLSIDQDLLIVAISYTKGQDGEKTILELTGAGAFAPAPIIEQDALDQWSFE